LDFLDYYEYQLGADTVIINYFSEMSGEQEIDKSFPYFEEHNFSGWLIQFKAMLPELDCDKIIETPSVGVLVS
jgi:hypothetical protein